MPSGGETFDMEAIYFDNKAGFAYFAVVTSMPESGVWLQITLWVIWLLTWTMMAHMSTA